MLRSGVGNVSAVKEMENGALSVCSDIFGSGCGDEMQRMLVGELAEGPLAHGGDSLYGGDCEARG
jgi:hypothetical protein